MQVESRIFGISAAFFFAAALAYALIADYEVVGTVCISLTGCLALMLWVYFGVLARRHGRRPEDRADADIATTAGDQGVYAPWSWWPLVVAISAALGFLALAVGWWLMVPAGMMGVIGLVGWVFEFSRGQHAH